MRPGAACPPMQHTEAIQSNPEEDTVNIEALGINRRDFLKYCSAMAVYMGLPASLGVKIAEAAESARRPSVIWISGQECTGCVESLLRLNSPTLETLILEKISLDYSETLSTPSGHLAEEAMHAAIEENNGKFILVVEGAIPVKDGGIYCKIAGKTFLDIVRDTAKDAAAVIAIGSCASWGGVPSAEPNPTGATPAHEVLKDMKVPVINLPGCPANPYNFISTVMYYLTFNKLPELDAKHRPKFAYGRLIHENCERRPHFDAGRFAYEFGDEGHRKGYCLYQLGCKGPETYNNCPTQLYGDAGSSSWPVGTGHPCFGCSEQHVGFHIPLFTQAKVQQPTAGPGYPEVDATKGTPVTLGAAAVLGAGVGAVLGASAVVAKNLKKDSADQTTEKKPE